jgi:hypothetical protein
MQKTATPLNEEYMRRRLRTVSNARPSLHQTHRARDLRIEEKLQRNPDQQKKSV